MCACVLSHFSCVLLCAALWTVSPPGFSVYEILQARILEWIAMPSSMGSSQPRDQTHVSCVSYIGRQILYHWNHLKSAKTIILEVNTLAVYLAKIFMI